MQPLFKQRKPANLIIQSSEEDKIVQQQIQELDTFEEFCSNIPDVENQELNFTKESKSFSSQPINLQESQEFQYNPKFSDQKQDEIQESHPIQYIEFVEFHPQSINSGQSESNYQRIDSQPSPKDIMQEPPAPQNKNLTKFSFPQKGGCFSSLKKQLCVEQPIIINHGNQSEFEETLVKQHNNQTIPKSVQDDLIKQIKELNDQKNAIETTLQTQIQSLQNQNQKLEQELVQQKQKNCSLVQENMLLQSKIQILEQKKSTDLNNITDFSNDLLPHKLSMNDKLVYLLQKLNAKTSENAKLQYEILKLQNNIEILETQKYLQINPNLLLETHKLQQSHSPLIQPQSQNRGQSLSKDSRTSLLNSQKYPLNLSLNYVYQGERRQEVFINKKNRIISPLAHYSSVGEQQQLQLTNLQKNKVYKEDVNYNNKMHTKNSTSVGELISFKQDLTNCSNMINKALRKESYSTQSPDGKVTQKFKQTLNAKIGAQQENSKSYASLLFSLGEKQKDVRQMSPKGGNKKSKQLFGFIMQPHPNSRKQSEILKSEESHKMSHEQLKMSDKKNTLQTSIDIFQIMRDMRVKKSGISTKQSSKKGQAATSRQLITEIKSSRTNKPSFD
ncbi:unnamed protein product (macronuclear) [Paramecium tetraurelia]|uniref:Uncharacterized protein n=1 Tax=Paramecium tetraurelia TaxID=5888 RepID=A0BFJ6_PARTE|nr:uncharacterized protein GSPATT00028348001 [Paramecium tetraurelia]CAK57313.1 unnamed protein product [Paramecium tetraurelia]|eukprot:XP_001424711.1 hypothetical protein (macronuclear) [Paramecium tetraurelia strain d4-2]